ncbi:MAG: hypothetical protein A4S09_02895 [Proteobacteria bacterium SG_bin7]|nr:MAG: hypothetical protein A4S09_02895 [Proteobacteria bacterium SG_bin7]
MKDIMKLLTPFCSFLLLICCYSAQGEISVLKVEKKKAVVQFDGATEGLKKGDKLRATDGANEALIIISKVKGNKAVALVKTGEAKKGMKATKIENAKQKDKDDSIAAEPSEGNGKKKIRWGASLGANLGTMSVRLTSGGTTETANMTGTSFGAKGYGEIPIGRTLWIRAGFGYEMIDVKGTIANSLCGSSTQCIAQLPFISADGIGGWNFINGKTKMYLLGGAGLLFPMGPSTNALDNASIKQSAAIKAGAGISFGKKNRFPIEVEYNMLPASSDVKTTFIQVRGGITF